MGVAEGIILKWSYVWFPHDSLMWKSWNLHNLTTYNKIVSTVAWKNLSLSPFDIRDDHIFLMSLRAFQASAFRTLMSFSELCILAPGYLKSSTFLRAAPLSVLRGSWSMMLYAMYSVFLVFKCSPTFLHSVSTLSSNSCASLRPSLNNCWFGVTRFYWFLALAKGTYVVNLACVCVCVCVCVCSSVTLATVHCNSRGESRAEVTFGI